MPRGDRTGPTGAGPMTGRGAGYCAGFNAAGFQNAGGGFGRGCGRGRGLGFGNQFAQPAQPVQQQNPTEMAELKEQMARIEKRLEELQG